MRQKRATTQYHFACQCVACTQNWPVYNELAGKVRSWKVNMTQELLDEAVRQTGCYNSGMENLIRLDVLKAFPLFRDYLLIMNELVEHPDPRYIDCEEAYKQCLWLENRGYKVKPVPVANPLGGQPQQFPPQYFGGFSASNPRQFWALVDLLKTNWWAQWIFSHL